MFDELKRYVQFGADDETRLASLLPRLQPHFSAIVEDFYGHILNHAGARAAITGGDAQVERLKGTLMAWLTRVFRGPWDQAYYEQSARIGRRHVQIGLPQQYMFAAMDVIRVYVSNVILGLGLGTPETPQSLAAVNRILDMELAIQLHTYREDYQLAVQRTERLATFGQLVASIGHELRNPLSVIESSMYLLRNRLPVDERAARHMDRVDAQVKLSNRIISDLLDMVRDRPPHRTSVDVASFITPAVESHQGTARTSLGVSIPVNLPRVHVDGGQMQQVMMNLVSNAVDAAGAHGEICVEAETRGDWVVVRVEDNGPGIDPSIRNRLFEPLVTTKVRGVGLGLALCKKTAERNGARIALATGRRLRGAAFELTLPTKESAT
jgi:signal transduction histidine kinase